MNEPRPSLGEWLKQKRTEPIVITVQRYLCPHCRRGHSKASAAREHIARCWKNPDARACKTCVHFEQRFDYEHCGALQIDLNWPRVGCDSWKGPVE